MYLTQYKSDALLALPRGVGCGLAPAGRTDCLVPGKKVRPCEQELYQVLLHSHRHAILWAAGIGLLLISYVRPTLARQAQGIDENAATEWLRLANASLGARRTEMLRLAGQWAAGPIWRRL